MKTNANHFKRVQEKNVLFCEEALGRSPMLPRFSDLVRVAEASNLRLDGVRSHQSLADLGNQLTQTRELSRVLSRFRDRDWKLLEEEFQKPQYKVSLRKALADPRLRAGMLYVLADINNEQKTLSKEEG